MTRTYSNTDPEVVRTFAVEAARLIADLKCSEVVLLDVRGQSQVCDYIVIGSGTSQRQMKSVAADLGDLGDTMAMAAYRSNRDEGTTWIVVDFVEVVVHLFEPEQRLYYDLELMWSQGKRVDWQRTATTKDAAPVAAKSARGKSSAKAAAASSDAAAEGADEAQDLEPAKAPAKTKPKSKAQTKTQTKTQTKAQATTKPKTKSNARGGTGGSTAGRSASRGKRSGSGGSSDGD